MSAKDILVKPISATEANALVKRVHYSGKVVQNSQLHLGVYYAGKLEGVMSFGPSLDKKKMLNLVEGTAWNGFTELNRMAFTDVLPKNSESRAISIAMKMLKKHAPTLEWVVSFADGTQCGDGTIYRASGFVLTQIKENNSLYLFPTGDIIAAMTLEANWHLPIVKAQADHLGIPHIFRTRKTWEKFGAKPLPGFQLRYIYYLNPEARKRSNMVELPFSEIAARGATMYKGTRGGNIDGDVTGFQPEQGGSIPTPLLQPNEGNAPNNESIM